MILDKFDDILPPERVKKLLIFSIILLFIVYSLMGYFFFLANNPGNVIESQLSFSGTYMKNYYKNIGNIDYYRIVEAIDYGFMIAYSSLIVSLTLIIARKFEKESRIRTSGYIMALLGIIAACLDAAENCFIMLMLTDPSGFPNAWAIMHSTFALIKWIILLIVIMWALITLVIRIVKKD
ncbi:MAG: hypothetical protein ACTSQJ_13940 [Promethearchaeota archaeon]